MATRTSAAPNTATRSLAVTAALAMTGFSMRTTVTSVGAVLDNIETDLRTTSAMAGVLTTLPVLCFAGMGALAPRVAARFDAHRVLIAALVVAAAGTALRPLASSIWPFLLLSVPALAGGAVANVLLPSLVKLHFPDRIGTMTAVYTTALAVGTTAAAGLTVPIGGLGDGWRVGIGSWALFTAVAVLPWLATLRGRDALPATASTRISLVRNRTAWQLTIFFGSQSALAYIGFGWIARFLHAHGITESTAGWMVALLSAIGIPVSMVVPLVPPARHRSLIAGLAACFAVAIAGLGLAPVGGAWAWMVLYGIGSGMFPVVLTMIGLHTRTAETTAAVSAFAQAIGYLVAGSGPLLFGVLYGATSSWTLPITLMWVALAMATIAGWLVAGAGFVDDER